MKEPALHGGRSGWFRVASGFTALAAVEMGFATWSVAHPSATTVFYSPSIAASLALGAICLAYASFLASRRRAVAGLFILPGYALPVIVVFAQQRIVVPPSVPLIIGMFALVMATRRPVPVTEPTA